MLIAPVTNSSLVLTPDLSELQLPDLVDPKLSARQAPQLLRHPMPDGSVQLMMRPLE